MTATGGKLTLRAANQIVLSAAVRPLAILTALTLLADPTASQSAGRFSRPPKNGFPKLGTCYVTRVVSVEGRSGGEPTDDSGSQVEMRNGVVQVSYEVVPAIVHSRRGDKVTMCVVELPKHCPPGDFRGVVYRSRNWRTEETWTLSDAEHDCGGA